LRRFLGEAPCSQQEQNLLRAVFQQESAGQTARARAIIEAVERMGLEPYHAPEPLPPICVGDVHLVCWLAIEKNG
jgi:hypothetical protein